MDKLKFSVKANISDNQFAYRQSLGTTDAILQLLDDCTSDLDIVNNKYVQLGFLDFSKAFDKLQPSIVIDKMRKCGINEFIRYFVQFFRTKETVRESQKKCF